MGQEERGLGWWLIGGWLSLNPYQTRRCSVGGLRFGAPKGQGQLNPQEKPNNKGFELKSEPVLESSLPGS